MDQDDLEIAPDADLLPRYSKPKVHSAMLPGILLSSLRVNNSVISLFLCIGGMHYLLVHKPRIDHQSNPQNEVNPSYFK